MKYLYVIAIIFATIAMVVFFDAIVIFLLSGFIPGINITLPPTTSIAVMIASTITVAAAAQYRTAVYAKCLALYDAFFFKKKKSSNTTKKKKSSDLPKRRYQSL